MNTHFSHFFVILSAMAIGHLPMDASASPEPSGKYTANQALRSLEAIRGRQVVSTIVGIAGFFGQDQPLQWRLLAADAKVPNLMHEYALQDGKIVKERHFSRRPEEDLPYIPVPLGNLRIDSPRAFAIVNANAKRAGVGFDSVHYQLRCRDLRNEPIWVLNLIDQSENSVGVQYISAISGETLRSVWHRPGTQEYTRVNNHGIFNKIGKTIGGASKRVGDAGRSIANKNSATQQPPRGVAPVPVPNYRPQVQQVPVTPTAPRTRKVEPLPR